MVRKTSKLALQLLSLQRKVMIYRVLLRWQKRLQSKLPPPRKRPLPSHPRKKSPLLPQHPLQNLLPKPKLSSQPVTVFSLAPLQKKLHLSVEFLLRKSRAPVPTVASSGVMSKASALLQQLPLSLPLPSPQRITLTFPFLTCAVLLVLA